MALRYDLTSSPPPAVLAAAIAQHMGLMAVTLVFPLLVAQAAGADVPTQARYLDLAMLAMGVATLLQASGLRIPGLPPIGSGFLLPAVFTAAYLPAALAAARGGGLGAVAGMTLAAGVTQVVLSRFIGRLRPYLSIEIVGLAVLLIGIILGIVAFKLVVGFGEPHPPGLQTSGAALLALVIMCALSVWGGARLRTMAVLVGLVAGTAFSFALGAAGTGPNVVARDAAFLVWPLVVPSFEAGLLPGFLAGALACTLRGFGDIVASQRANDADWKRPDYPNIEAGVLADGLGTLAAGLIGTMGLNTYSASVGLSVATQVLARRVALGVGFAWIALALTPGSATLVLSVPRAVLGAALLFASAFIVLSGIAILGQRMLDARRTLVVGCGLIVGLSFDEVPAFYAEALSPLMHSVISSSLTLGLFVALALNALFRFGAGKSYRMAWQAQAGFAPLRQFLDDAARSDGARSDAVARLVQAAEEFSAAAPALSPDGPIAVTAQVDEYTLRLTFAWEGSPLRPGPAPSLEPGTDEDAVMHGITYLLMARLCDRLTRSETAPGRQELACEVDQ